MDSKKRASLTNRKYIVPFILITTLFFMWGFARTILDLLNKHFQTSLDISITKSAFIQVITYLAYFLLAIPAGWFIQRYGYRRGVVFGLCLFGCGALLFIPGAHLGSFYAFLGALFIIACGLTFLETAANPYSTELGPKETATSRLNLSQTFNGLGAALAPIIVGGYLFRGKTSNVNDVIVPYAIMGVVVLVIAVIFSRVNLPEIKHDDTAEEQAVEKKFGNRYKALLKHSIFVFGVIALLAYEVSEISINSYFINFATKDHYIDGELIKGLMSPLKASVILSAALFLFMGGRFLGSIVMTFIKAEKVLLGCAVMCILCMITILLAGPGKMAISAVVANFLFEAIMFPTIFSLALRGMGDLTKTASSILMMTPVGGCFFLVMGYIAEAHMMLPFVVPLLGYIVILVFAYVLVRRKGVANYIK